ncbi:hypothetical protein G7046_g9152 [Stylonectria norvegica]|nr:hypothetical protein G7046_g9152 [Stylonectria norvegica]
MQIPRAASSLGARLQCRQGPSIHPPSRPLQHPSSSGPSSGRGVSVQLPAGTGPSTTLALQVPGHNALPLTLKIHLHASARLTRSRPRSPSRPLASLLSTSGPATPIRLNSIWIKTWTGVSPCPRLEFHSMSEYSSTSRLSCRGGTTMHHRGASSSAVAPSFTSPAGMSSSPAAALGLLSPTRTSRRREKRNPSVTPRRFGRFFTPRPILSTLPTARRILGSLGSSDVNRQPLSPQSLFSDPLTSDPASPSPTKRLSNPEDDSRKRRWQGQGEEQLGSDLKRRVILLDPMPLPQLNFQSPTSQILLDEASVLEQDIMPEGIHKSISRDSRKPTLKHYFRANRGGSRGTKEKTLCDPFDLVSTHLHDPLVRPPPTIPHFTQLTPSQKPPGYQPQPIRKFADRGFEAQLLDRAHGFSSHTGRQYLSFPACDPRTETAAFTTGLPDAYQCGPQSGTDPVIPFCVTSLHHSPYTAIGDEAGIVHLFHTGKSEPGKQKVDQLLDVYDNAIMDLSFSDNDMRLAVACGSKTGTVVDVPTQTIAAELRDGHTESLRQVAFQPNSGGNTIASSDRAGRVQIWDMRCSAAPIGSFSTADSRRSSALNPFPARTVNTLDNTHERTVEGITNSVSVTAIKWLPPGREHLLLSASEANACIKLWDTRYIKPRREIADTPLATTLAPSTHAWRPYGITSLALSSDAARLYAVCKDSTVYAYSMAHLMLGHAPELLDGAPKRRPSGLEGLDPLYGLKHDCLSVQSFYVKCAMRPRTGRHASDLLAVGSSADAARRHIHTFLLGLDIPRPGTIQLELQLHPHISISIPHVHVHDASRLPRLLLRG